MVAKKSFLIVITHYISDILGFIGIMILAKLLGDFSREALGLIAIGMSSLSIFGIVSDLGFSNSHLKRVSEGKDIGKCLGTFVTIKLILIGLMIILIISALYIWKILIKGSFYDSTIEQIIIIMIIYQIFNSLNGIVTNTFNGTNEIAKLQITSLAENFIHVPLSIIVALAGVTVMGYSISPAVNWGFLTPLQKFLANHSVGSLAMTYVFGVMATFFVGIWLMRRYPIKKLDKEYLKSYSSYALSTNLFLVIHTISSNLDKILIGYYFGSVFVGDYYIAQKIVNIMTVIFGSVSVVLFPTISKLYAKNKIDEIKKLIHLAERYFSMIAIPLYIGLFLFANQLIMIIFNEKFILTVPIILTMSIGKLIQMMTTPYSTLIPAINFPGYAPILGGLIIISNFVLNYLIIPSNGILSKYGISGGVGASFLFIINAILSYCILRYYAKKLIGIKLFQIHTPKHILAGMLMGGILYYLVFILNIFNTINWYILISLSLFGLSLYLSILYLLHEFTKKDLYFFLNILKPKEMISYIKTEIKK